MILLRFASFDLGGCAALSAPQLALVQHPFRFLILKRLLDLLPYGSACF
jgi:hypothetical protein